MEDIPLETALRKATKQAQKQTENADFHDLKKKFFTEAYFRCNGVTNEIARELNIHRVQVWRYRKKFGLL